MLSPPPSLSRGLARRREHPGLALGDAPGAALLWLTDGGPDSCENCEVELPPEADLDPARTRVTLGGVTLGYGVTDGWNSPGPGLLHVRGSACDDFRRGTEAAALDVSCVP